MLFFKSTICCETLVRCGDHDYCYIDADCLALANCDDIFDSCARIEQHPLLGRNNYDFMYWDEPDGTLRGNVWANGVFDVSLCLEANIFKYLGVDINKRSQFYRQSNIILFNTNCTQFMMRWEELSEEPTIRENWIHYAPLADETLINALLWRDGFDGNLGQVSLNVPSNIGGTFSPDSRVELFVDAFNHPWDEKYQLTEFCDIPSKTEIGHIKFLHGKLTPSHYKIIESGILTTWQRPNLANRAQLISFVGERAPKGLGVEVGSFKGEFAKTILESWSGSLYMVDVWRKLGEEYSDMSNCDDAYVEAMKNVVGYEDRAIMVRASSRQAAKMFPDQSLDFVYIDANHSYDFIMEDLGLWYPKVKTGGFLCGHDYLAIDWNNDPNFADEKKKNKFIWSQGSYMGLFGVNPAVDEFCIANGIKKRVTQEWLGSWYIQKR
jgi:hypothetical protein